jgi:hypothetical protein
MQFQTRRGAGHHIAGNVTAFRLPGVRNWRSPSGAANIRVIKAKVVTHGFFMLKLAEVL